MRLPDGWLTTRWEVRWLHFLTMNETRRASRRVAAASIGLLILGGGVAQGQRLLSLGPGTETAGVAAAAQFEPGMGR